MKIFIEVAWVCSTGFGILLFFVEVGILSWVKFFNTANGEFASADIYEFEGGGGEAQYGHIRSKDRTMWGNGARWYGMVG